MSDPLLHSWYKILNQLCPCMDSLHIGDLLCSTWNIGWADVVSCRDSQRIDLNLHILHDSCWTGAHIDDLRIFDYFVRFEHCFADCYRCSVQLRLSGRLLGSFVDSLSLGGSWSWRDFLLHRLHTKMLCRFSCYTGNLSLCVLHVLSRCCRSTLFEQIERPIDLCLADSYL